MASSADDRRRDDERDHCVVSHSVVTQSMSISRCGRARQSESAMRSTVQVGCFVATRSMREANGRVMPGINTRSSTVDARRHSGCWRKCSTASQSGRASASSAARSSNDGCAAVGSALNSIRATNRMDVRAATPHPRACDCQALEQHRRRSKRTSSKRHRIEARR